VEITGGERKVRDGGGQWYAGLTIGGILCDGQVSAYPSLPRDVTQGCRAT